MLPATATEYENRHWTVYILNSSHLDIGWHALPDVIRERIAGYVDEAVGLCADPQYRFTLEHSWVLAYYEQHRSKEQFQKLIECIRRGQIEVGAMYTSVHTDMCGHEELVRLMSAAAEYRRRFGLRIETAILNDVGESYTFGLAQVLARSAVKYFCLGPGAKANVRGIVPRVPRVFQWLAKDGSSVVVAWTPGIWTYARWSEAGYKGEATLREFASLPDYPYDVIFRHGGKGDISSPDPELPNLVKQYRKETPEADVRLSTATGFFDNLSTRFKRQMPAISGDAADSWADGVISLARETGIHRRTQAQLLRAEILSAIAGLDCRTEIAQSYSNLQMYADHTWGFDFDPDGRPGQIHSFTRDLGGGKQKKESVPAGDALGPGSPLMREYEASWEAKKRYAYDAAATTQGVLERSLAALAPERPNAVAVWNTLSWSRSGLVRLKLPTGVPFGAVRPVDGGEWLAVQVDRFGTEEHAVFFADDVPGFSCKIYEVRAGTSEQARVEPGARLENSMLDAKVDPKAACIQSIVDKRSSANIVNESSDYGLGQYIYDDVNDFYVGWGGGGRNKSGYAFGAGNRTVAALKGEPMLHSGPVFSSLRWDSEAPNVPGASRLQSRLLLMPGRPEIRFECLVRKRATPSKEQIYFAFPFDVGGTPSISAELAYTSLDWDRDILPGSWRGYSCYRNYVRAAGPSRTITWSALDAPVVSIGGINSNKWDPQWHDTYKPKDATFYSYVMSNIWNCNYPLYQGGNCRFDYAFKVADAASTKSDSFRFGWEAHHPLEAVWSGSGDGPKSTNIGVHLDAENVAATAFKRADASPGYILRVFETSGTGGTAAKIKLDAKWKSVRICNLMEEEQGPADVRGNTVQVSLKAHEVVTLKLLA